jgi:hypothetical protein
MQPDHIVKGAWCSIMSAKRSARRLDRGIIGHPIGVRDSNSQKLTTFYSLASVPVRLKSVTAI